LPAADKVGLCLDLNEASQVLAMRLIFPNGRWATRGGELEGGKAAPALCFCCTFCCDALTLLLSTPLSHTVGRHLFAPPQAGKKPCRLFSTFPSFNLLVKLTFGLAVEKKATKKWLDLVEPCTERPGNFILFLLSSVWSHPS